MSTVICPSLPSRWGQAETPPPDPFNYTLTTPDGSFKGKSASNVGVVVLAVKTASSIGGEFVKEQAQGQFVLVRVGVGNHQKDQITVDANSFKILANGKEYSHSTEGSTALMMSDEKTFFLQGLNPDMTAVGWVVFDVPPSLDLAKAELQFTGGFTGRTGVLPLQPIKQ